MIFRPFVTLCALVTMPLRVTSFLQMVGSMEGMLEQGRGGLESRRRGGEEEAVVQRREERWRVRREETSAGDLVCQSGEEGNQRGSPATTFSRTL